MLLTKPLLSTIFVLKVFNNLKILTVMKINIKERSTWIEFLTISIFFAYTAFVVAIVSVSIL